MRGCFTDAQTHARISLQVSSPELSGINVGVAETPFQGNRWQHMVRVLFLMRCCGTNPGEDAPDGALSEMRGQVRIQKLDFWMRNPDYLADELLNDYEAGHGPEDAMERAKAILDEREPELRRLPMTRWRFGAYEALDDVLAPLVARGIVVHRPTASSNRVREHSYWFMQEGEEFAKALLNADPEVFGWHDERARLIAAVARDLTGSAMKDRQYKQAEYAGAELSVAIEPITARVRERLGLLQEANT